MLRNGTKLFHVFLCLVAQRKGMIINMENLCAYNYPHIAQREGVRHVIQEEFGQFKNEIVNELDNILSFNRMENSFDNHAETRELIKRLMN